MPQERRPAHLEARAITAACPAKDYNYWNNKAQTLKKACFRGYPKSTICVQVPVGSRNPAIHNAYRTSLRPSSLFEPRHPSLKVVSSSGSRHERRNAFKYRNAMASRRKQTAAGTTCSKKPISPHSPREPAWGHHKDIPTQTLTEEFTMDYVEHVRMILPQVHLRKPCYDFSFL